MHNNRYIQNIQIYWHTNESMYIFTIFSELIVHTLYFCAFSTSWSSCTFKHFQNPPPLVLWSPVIWKLAIRLRSLWTTNTQFYFPWSVTGIYLRSLYHDLRYHIWKQFTCLFSCHPWMWNTCHIFLTNYLLLLRLHLSCVSCQLSLVTCHFLFTKLYCWDHKKSKNT